MASSANSRANDAAEAWRLGLFDTKKACAEAFEITKQTLNRRLNRAHDRIENGGHGRKLNNALEEAVCGWITRMGKFNLAPSLELIRDTANFVLRTNNSKEAAPSPPSTVGKNWPARFVQRHPEFAVRRGHALELERINKHVAAALAAWYDKFAAIVAELGVGPEAIYNMDETGFFAGKRVGEFVVV